MEQGTKRTVRILVSIVAVGVFMRLVWKPGKIGAPVAPAPGTATPEDGPTMIRPGREPFQPARYSFRAGSTQKSRLTVYVTQQREVAGVPGAWEMLGPLDVIVTTRVTDVSESGHATVETIFVTYEIDSSVASFTRDVTKRIVDPLTSSPRRFSITNRGRTRELTPAVDGDALTSAAREALVPWLPELPVPAIGPGTTWQRAERRDDEFGAFDAFSGAEVLARDNNILELGLQFAAHPANVLDAAAQPASLGFGKAKLDLTTPAPIEASRQVSAVRRKTVSDGGTDDVVLRTSVDVTVKTIP